MVLPRYSGAFSKPFWKAVHELKDKASHQEVYSIGCALQDLESRVLRSLEVAQLRESKPRTAREKAKHG